MSTENAPTSSSPSGSNITEAEAFLAKYPDVEAIDIILTDFHGIGRGKTIRRHELLSIYKSGRGLPSSIFGQDVTGEDVDDCGLGQTQFFTEQARQFTTTLTRAMSLLNK